MKIGVLALQGAFREHCQTIRRCGIETAEIRLPEQLEEIDGLIMPGGESTTIIKLMVKYAFPEAIKNFSLSGKPLFGTCAGAILLADKVDGEKQNLLNLIDIDISRNAYGRQIDSREATINITCCKTNPFNAIFIRAPIILSIGPDVIPLGFYQERVVIAQQNTVLVATFHPELTENIEIHEYFVNMVKEHLSSGLA